MTKIYVLHENAPWVEPLEQAFDAQQLPYDQWYLDEAVLRFDEAPPPGVFYNRMSASSHTRGHRFAPELTAGVLNWLEAHGRRVVNDSRALYLELSKLAQYAALQRVGIKTPRTLAAVGRDKVLEAAATFGKDPIILKPNRGGKGLGVQLFYSIEAIEAYLDGPGASEEAPIDGLWLLQDYIRAPEPYITRAEFVGGKFLYAVRVDTSEGFELCPADACNLDNSFCPADAPANDKFTIVTDFAEHSGSRSLIESYERFLGANGIEIAGIEFIRNKYGEVFTYDINTNTNYNAQAEKKAELERSGMEAVAQFLGAELARLPISHEGIARGIVAAE
jgi:hypothetical protein